MFISVRRARQLEGRVLVTGRTVFAPEQTRPIL